MNNQKALKADVFSKQKILAKIYSEFGQHSLADYSNHWRVLASSSNSRKFIAQTQKLLEQVYGLKEAAGSLSQAAQTPLVSTIDHHGILNHPFFVNSNLIYSLRPDLKYLLCFSTAGVSFNNSSWPGCLLLTAPDGRLRRFSFFPDKAKIHTVLAGKSFNLEDALRIKRHIETADFLTQDSSRRLSKFLEEIFADQKIFGFGGFSEQAAYISTKLWEKVFPKAPLLLYLPLERAVSEVVINEIAPHKEHILHKLLFTLAGWDSIEKIFHGSLGAFTSSHKGSFLFWGVDAKGRRIHLARQNNQLANGDFVIPAEVESIVQNLRVAKLYPTSLVCFLVLLYYGITCLGGFNQVNWLTDIKEKFTELLTQWAENDLSANILASPTENFAEGNLAFDINTQGQIYKPTLLDLFLKNDDGLFDKYMKLASLLTVGESIETQLPEIYKVITPSGDRESKFLNITEGDILNDLGTIVKIKSALYK